MSAGATMSRKERLGLALFLLGSVGVIWLAWFLDSLGLGGLESLLGLSIATVGAIVLGRLPRWIAGAPPWLVGILSALFPGVADRQEALRESWEVCDEFDEVLRFYGLDPIAPGERAALVAELQSPQFDGKRHRIRRGARVLATHRGTSEDLLRLLYYERHRPMPQSAWPPPGQKRERLVAELAPVLARQAQVSSSVEPELVLHGPELEGPLRDLRTFRLEDVLVEVRALRELWRVVQAYWSFSRGNFADLQSSLLPAEVLETVATEGGGFPPGPESVEDLQQTLPGVLTRLGRDVVRSWLDQNPDAASGLEEDDVHAVTLISVATFFGRPGDAPGWNHLARVCHQLAGLGADGQQPWRGTGVRMVWAFLVAKQEHRSGLWGEGQHQLRLDRFLLRRAEILGRRQEEEDELRALYFALQQGTWIVRREDLVELVGERAREHEEPKPDPVPVPPAKLSPAPVASIQQKDALDVIDLIPSSEGPLRELFLRLDLQTIERLTESKHIRPYLLTVTRSDEPVTDLLDCLASARKADELAEVGIEFRTAAGEQKYNFVQYTPYSRIGLTPPSLAFVDFCKELQQDLDRALRRQDDLLAPHQLKDRQRPDDGEPMEPVDASAAVAREEIRSFEVLAHLFRPAVGNPFEFGEGERRGMLKLKHIFAEHIDRQTLAHLPDHLEHIEPALRVPVVRRLIAGPISRVSGLPDTLDRDALALLDPMDTSIKRELLARLGVGPHDEERLLDLVRSDSDERPRTVDTLARIIRRHVTRRDLDDEQVRQVAEAYVSELEGLILALADLEAAVGRGFLVSSA